jgi:hypothetical protein
MQPAHFARALRAAVFSRHTASDVLGDTPPYRPADALLVWRENPCGEWAP